MAIKRECMAEHYHKNANVYLQSYWWVFEKRDYSFFAKNFRYFFMFTDAIVLEIGSDENVFYFLGVMGCFTYSLSLCRWSHAEKTCTDLSAYLSFHLVIASAIVKPKPSGDGKHMRTK